MKIPYYQLSRKMFICLFSTHWLFGGVTVRYWIFQKSEPIFWRQFFWGPASFIQRSYESLNPISSNQNTWSIQKKTTSPSRYHRRAGVPSADGRICGSMCWGQTSPGPNNPFATAWQYQRPGATSVELLEVKEHGPYCEIFGRFFKSEVYLNFGYKLTWKNGGNWIVGDVHHLGVEIFQTQIKYGGSWDSVHRFTLMHPPTGSMLSLHILMSHSVHHHGIPPNHRLSWIEYLHGKDLMCEFGAVIF